MATSWRNCRVAPPGRSRILWRPFLDDPPVGHEHDPVGDLARKATSCLPRSSSSGLGQPADHAEHLGPSSGSSAEGLIEEHDPGEMPAPGDRDALLLAAGEP